MKNNLGWFKDQTSKNSMGVSRFFGLTVPRKMTLRAENARNPKWTLDVWLREILMFRYFLLFLAENKRVTVTQKLTAYCFSNRNDANSLLFEAK